MRLYLLLFFTCCAKQLSLSQITEGQLKTIERLTADKINKHRLTKGLPSLVFDKLLYVAAQNQSEYMLKTKTLSHGQPTKSLMDPATRVKTLSNEYYDKIGENVASYKPIFTQFTDVELETVAQQLFMQWKFSPGHYANMVDKNFTNQALSCTFDPITNTFYATQVFSKDGIKIARQLSSNAFNVQPSWVACNYNKMLMSYDNVISNLGNSITIENEEVVLYYNDIDLFKSVFADKKLQLAADLLENHQFACAVENQLDKSPIYDGVMLEPIAYDQLIANNRANNVNRLVTSLGKVPAHLKGKPLTVSLIFIKDGTFCQYVYPITVASANIDALIIAPKLKQVATKKYVSEGVTSIDYYLVSFDNKDTIPRTTSGLNEQLRKIEAIEIRSFSSVNGNAQNNRTLATKRATWIMKELRDRLRVSPSIFTVHAEENWKVFETQLISEKGIPLHNLSRAEVKEFFAVNENVKKWKTELEEQRDSYAILYTSTKINNNGNYLQFLESNLMAGMYAKDFEVVNTILLDMYSNNTFQQVFFEAQYVREFFETHAEVLTNVTALYSAFEVLDDNEYYFNFVYKWLTQGKQIEESAKYNLLNIYVRIANEYFTIWDLKSELLKNFLDPEMVLKLNTFPTDVEFQLNFNLMMLNYYSQINESSKYSIYFSNIESYLKKERITMENVVKIALFYNYWSLYSSAVELLKPYFEKGTLNGEGTLILAETLQLFPNYLVSFKDKVAVAALQKEKDNWCNWINNNIQSVRIEKVKSQRCNSCR